MGELDKIVQARVRANTTGCGIRLLAVPFGVAVAAFALAVPALTPRGYEAVAIVGAPLLLMAAIGVGLYVAATYLIRTRAVALDAAFGFLGPGVQTSVVGRGWAGEHAGRQANAWFSKGPQLELYLSATTHARVGASRDNQLARFAAGALDREPIAVDGLVVIGPDAAWAARWLEQPGVRDALPVLLQGLA